MSIGSSLSISLDQIDQKIQVRDGPLENLWGGAGEVQKKYSRKAKLNEKNLCTLINSKKYSCYALKKIHTRNLITKKNSCGSKIPLPPHNFSNGPSKEIEQYFGLNPPSANTLVGH